MAENTKIQWCDHTFNPWRGCAEVHPGCDNCYARTMSKRNPATLGVWGPAGTRVLASERQWKLPVEWNREAACDCYRVAEYGEGHLPSCPQSNRPRVFCASLADVFENWAGSITDSKGREQWINTRSGMVVDRPVYWHARRMTLDDVRARLFALIDATPNLDWLLVTKRPENVRRMWGWCDGDTGRLAEVQRDTGETVDGGKPYRRNVWLLTSISDQQTADAMIPELLKCRNLCPVLGLSAEPLLGPVDLGRLVWKGEGYDSPEFQAQAFGRRWLDWVIIGGESGPDARGCNVEWIRNLVRQCKQAGVPAFVKQLGARPIDTGKQLDWPEGVAMCRDPDWGNGARIMLTDKKGGDPEEWPEDLRVREFPEVRA